MRILARKLKYALWTLNGYVGRKMSIDRPQKATVLITYFHPVRMNYIGSQVRNILKCTFVDKVIVSNHNPDIRIEDKVNISDKRLICMNQPTKRACGYRWRIANALKAEYLVTIDDDVLLFPSQLKILFEHLLREPEVPHGFSGMLHLEDGEFQYREREDIDVDYLCEVYAVTRKHVVRYAELENLLAEQDVTLLDTVDRLGDFIVISQTGDRNPSIHKVGRLFRSDTFKTPGVANHKDEQFGVSIAEVSLAVDKIRSRDLAQTLDAGGEAAAELGTGMLTEA